MEHEGTKDYFADVCLNGLVILLGNRKVNIAF